MAKKPKKPKKSASVASWKRYDERISKYEHDRKTKDRLVKKHGG